MADTSIFSQGLSRRSFVAAGAAISASAILAQFGMPAVAHAASDTFIYAIAGDPSVSPNPVTTSDRFGLMTLKLVYSPLWDITNDGVKYFLAESHEVSEDGLTYTAHLRQGVTWNDGEPFTADDVVFSYETMRDTEVANGYSDLNYGDDGVVDIQKVDDYTVTFTFPFLNPAGGEALAGEKFIMPKHIYEGVTDFENNDVNGLGIGTGPYKLNEYQIGQYLSFSANESYFGGTPNIPNVVFQIVTNENTGMTAIQTGQVNAWIGTPAQVEQLNPEANNLTVTPYSENRVSYFCMNAKRVTDEKVRKAFFFSLDKKAIADAALLSDEYYALAYTFLPPANSWATEDVEKYDRDVEKAKQLLSEAGVSNPTLKFAYSADDSLQATAAVMIQEQAAEAGINVELYGMDATAESQAMKNPDNEYDLYYGGYIMGVDPDKYSQLFLTEGAYNYMHYDAPEVDELFAQGRQQTDEAARREIYNELQAKIADMAVFYPVYSNMRLLVTTANVAGMEEAGLVPIYTFEDMSKLSMTD